MTVTNRHLALLVMEDLYGRDSLCCPFCGEPNGIHLDVITMGGRPTGEDYSGMTVKVDHRAQITTTFVPEGEMPGRRHYVDLTFTCEHCDGGTIRLTQHKGSTFVDVDSGRP